MNKNINLEVAKFAMDCVENVIKNEYSIEGFSENKKICVDKSKYKTLVKKMGTMIKKNGYINTLAFCYSKKIKNSEHEVVLDNIVKWSKKNFIIKEIIDSFEQYRNKNITIDEYISIVANINNEKEYRIITKEIIVLFGWLKRFADGMID